jgi:pimeloyl-ACP methyl ester carboxylesterase
MTTRVLTAATAAVAALAVCVPAAAAAPLPVHFTVPQSLPSADEVAGANDFACKPTAQHPRPVVLVHGLGANQGENWATMSPLLKNNGFCVFALTYGARPEFPYLGGVRKMQDSSAELQALVDKVLAATGASQVDLVGHSEGTVMPRWYLSFRGGQPKVANYVMFTPLWDGTNLAGVGDLAALLAPFGSEAGADQLLSTVGCESCASFARGSPYLKAVDAKGKALAGIHFTNVPTKYDELVVPYTSGIIEAPNVTNAVLQDFCPTDYSEHAAVAWDPIAAQIMLNALDPVHALPVPCALVTPAGTPVPPPVGLRAADNPAPPAQQGALGCRTGRAVTIRLKARRGERITAISATVGRKRVATRRGTRLRSITLRRLTPGRHVVRLTVRTTKRTRTVVVRRTIRC